MSTAITTITHALRVHLAEAGFPVSLGHGFQLVAAALGYPSLEVRQATDERDELTSAMHWIVDVDQLKERARSLRITIDTDVFLEALAKACRECTGPRVHGSVDDLEEEFINAARQEAEDDDDVGIQMADTNTTGPWEANLDPAGATSPPFRIGDAFELGYEGTVKGDNDPDRPFSGDTVNVTVQVLLTCAGRRLIVGPPRIEVLSAELDFGDDGADEEEHEAPSYGFLEAIAMELDVPVTEREKFAGAEVTQRTTSSGAQNGYLINIRYCESSDVIDRLRAKHGSQEIPVWGASLDLVRSFDVD